MNIADLMRRVHQTAKDKGWWDTPDINIPQKLALIHSEVSEALEEYRNSKPPLYYTLDPSFASKPEGMVAELADVIIRVLDLCAALDLPIIEAIKRKCDYNDLRPYRHGGKKC